MARNLVETVMGAVVLAVAGMFIFLTYSTAQIRAVEGYTLEARFSKIGGLKKGSDVRISGIKVGTVIDHRLDGATFDAIVTLSIAPEIKVPVDSVATISSEGLLGDKYVGIEPGQETTYLAHGAAIAQTRDFRSIEDQVGEIIFLATGGKDSNSPK